jgi:hypothetical protein
MEFFEIGLQLLKRGPGITGSQVLDDRPPGPDHSVAAQRAEPDHPLLQEIDEGVGDGDEDLVFARFRELAIELNEYGRAPLRIVDDRFCGLDIGFHGLQIGLAQGRHRRIQQHDGYGAHRLGQIGDGEIGQPKRARQLAVENFGIAGGDERAAGRSSFQRDEAADLQRSQRFAYGVAADLELRGERALGRQLVAALQAVCTENLNTGVVVMKSAQDGV